MKLFHLALAGAFAAFTLAGCVDDTGKDTDDFETGDTEGDCNDVETLIQEIYADCGGGNWTFSAKTDGWTTDGVVNIDQTGIDPQYAWSEEHDLPSVDYSADGCWDELEATLPITTDWEAQEANVNTLFECSDPRKSTLTWMIRVYDTDSNMSDCAVWGEDPSFYDSYGCLNWNG